MLYTADFETNNSDKALEENKTHVWLWDLCNCENLEHTTGTDILDFFKELKTFTKSTTIYFHNLKFDGNFVLNFLLSYGFTKTSGGRMKVKEYDTCITDMGMFYSISFVLKNKVKIELRDSSKKIAGAVKDIAKAYKLPILKGEIDYKLDRPIGYIPSTEEIDYIHNDTEIIARVINILYDAGMNKLTSASDTMNKYKTQIGVKTFKHIYPILSIDIDDFIRRSYKGGIVIADERHREKIITQSVYAYDINSSYPSQMNNFRLPWGNPVNYEGKYIKDNDYRLYIQEIEVIMELKKYHAPTIINMSVLKSKNTYITDTKGMSINLVLTSVDLELMLEHYIIYDIKYIRGYKFRTSSNLFKEFIEPIYIAKQTTTGAEKQLNKMWLNSLYGKFATNPVHTSKEPYFEDETIKYARGDTDIGDPVYTAVASFITSYGRKQLLDAIQKNFHSFVYCDTDSIHLLEPAVEGSIEIDDNKLGAWGLEKIYSKSKYLGQKTYMGVKEDGKVDIKVAGCPQRCKDKITFDNFNFGATYHGKLLPKAVKGGIILVEGSFTLNRRD